jgi:hypothetical protein
MTPSWVLLSLGGPDNRDDGVFERLAQSGPGVDNPAQIAGKPGNL